MGPNHSETRGILVFIQTIIPARTKLTANRVNFHYAVTNVVIRSSVPATEPYVWAIQTTGRVKLTPTPSNTTVTGLSLAINTVNLGLNRATSRSEPILSR
jgi:hypothetical protein